jgi:hypothetical protein
MKLLLIVLLAALPACSFAGATAADLAAACETETGWRERDNTGRWVPVCGDDWGNEVYRPSF